MADANDPVNAVNDPNDPAPPARPALAPPAAGPAEANIVGIWLPAPSPADYLFIVSLPKLFE